MRQRIVLVSGMIALFMLVFICRLAWLQLAPQPANGQAARGRSGLAVSQRERTLLLDSGRGDLYDRSGIALTGQSYEALALFPVNRKQRGSASQIGKLAAVLGVGKGDLAAELERLREPQFWKAKGSKVPMPLTNEQVKRLKRLRLNGIVVLPYRNRYPENEAGIHALGYVSENPERLKQLYTKKLGKGEAHIDDLIGGAGLEWSLEKLLRGSGSAAVSFFTDGADNPLRGLDMRLTQPDNPYYPLKVTTTLDLPLQRELERYLKRQGLTQGAVVVLDARSADIVSMISLPELDPLKIGRPGTDASNHAVKAYPPGSVFKLVTEAAALEAGVTDEREAFHCSGEYGRYGLSDAKRGGHGTLTLREGLAQSCNIVFATIAERLQEKQLLKAADQLGIGRRIGWSLAGKRDHEDTLRGPLRLLWEEEAGEVFAGGGLPADHDGGRLAQSGIGQRDVKMTPLQAANLVVTLLHRGHVLQPRLVKEIRYANGQRMAALSAHEAPSRYGRISPATAKALLRGMEAVVDHGTGRSIRAGVWKLAGKSGTAQIGRAEAADARNHQWFVGYGPVSAPRYAVAVLAENRPAGSANLAAKLFRGVMDILSAGS
ncbi:peptidoglycan D,D-transpeptidase FtsI family protein [Paenibacillus beijingensis]|uniref:Penicillin-binding protein n=1 Tax=Paenibacillus beijingensis TaxID=1126833 RepID=A0A0D5NMI9_9BACL|nr:penicillin-binding transpeptidase domain-containing protein [Paenibacillus beijingensis]AJY76118.1 penicillin-binding protein [Paenibacillus beijingensis]